MMVDIDLKILSAPSPPRAYPWVKVTEFSLKKSKFFVFKFKSQILGVSRAFLQLVERMVQIEPLDFFSLYFFLS